ncbi:MAG: glycosyltransferase family 8 protein [Candidatus Paraimprobicoccus trichonymphae]|uniref:Glycosyltransferase family 8 protein n=1 Tax=Candidatus Paraimprobicoccus trichonymphae TaxID=3033793 RepID=A0AA48IH96_9FIRM|nr:MAG: glycosyltransferase family 8 protein [Candidatus Paraimprobicoccus trichonymphae]
MKKFKIIILFILSIIFIYIVYVLLNNSNNYTPDSNIEYTNTEEFIENNAKEDINLKYVPIVISTDNNYTYPAVVSMTSLLENSDKNVFYKIHVLISNEFSKESKNKLLWLETKYDNCCIKFVNMKNIFEDAFVSGYITKETYFKLKIPSILKEEKKCIYLDTDTIILEDLYQLYNLNIKNCYVAGVADTIRSSDNKKLLENLKISNLNKYINCGVLLLNLEKCRASNIEMQFKKFISERKEIFHHDQDTINTICYDGIFELPFKFNVQTYYNLNDKSPKEFSKKEWDEGVEKPVIIHYPGKKPWNTLTWYAEKFWLYAKHTPYIEEIRIKYKQS